MLYYFKKSKNTTATHTHTQICVVYGEVALTDQTCQKWLAKSHAVDFSLDDAPQLSRAVAAFAVQSLNCVQLFATSRIAACQASLKAMAPHSSTLAWKNPMDRGACRQSMGLRRVRHDWATSLSLFTFMHGRRKWQTHSSVLAWRIPGMGSHRVGHDWSDLAAVAVAGFPQTHVHCVSDTIQPSHPLSSPSLAFYLSQPQVLFQWPGSLHQVAKV